MANRVLQEEFARLAWEPVDSSNVESIAYVPDFRRLWVRFLPKPGSKFTVYVYDDVTPATWDSFRAAPSKGGFLDARIKKGGYAYRPVF